MRHGTSNPTRFGNLVQGHKMYCLSILCCDFQFSTSCTYIVTTGNGAKNPQWSFSCCLALFLPLISLPGDISGLAGTNLVNNQLDTGHADTPTITGACRIAGLLMSLLKEAKTMKLGQRIPTLTAVVTSSYSNLGKKKGLSMLL